MTPTPKTFIKSVKENFRPWDHPDDRDAAETSRAELQPATNPQAVQPMQLDDLTPAAQVGVVVLSGVMWIGLGYFVLRLFGR